MVATKVALGEALSNQRLIDERHARAIIERDLIACVASDRRGGSPHRDVEGKATWNIAISVRRADVAYESARRGARPFVHLDGHLAAGFIGMRRTAVPEIDRYDGYS